MNAITLAILVHHYFISQPYDQPTLRETTSYPSIPAGYDMLLAEGLIDPVPASPRPAAPHRPSYMITPRGRCHVQALMSAPLPVQLWKSPIVCEAR